MVPAEKARHYLGVPLGLGRTTQLVIVSLIRGFSKVLQGFLGFASRCRNNSVVIASPCSP